MKSLIKIVGQFILGFKEDDSVSNDSRTRTPQQNGDDREAKSLIDRLRPKSR